MSEFVVRRVGSDDGPSLDEVWAAGLPIWAELMANAYLTYRNDGREGEHAVGEGTEAAADLRPEGASMAVGRQQAVAEGQALAASLHPMRDAV